MSEESLKQKTISGVIWSGFESLSSQGVQFLVMIVIARILGPRAFGLVGMLTVFMAVSQSLIDSGFSQALVRKQDRTETDCSTVFYFNICFSIIVYGLLFVIAPFVADFYKEPELLSVLRVLAVVIIIDSFAIVQRSLYTANVNFKVQARATFTGAFLAGCIAIVLAYKGLGVWSLVAMQILKSLISTILLWAFSNWFPKLVYSWNAFRELFSFGSKLMFSGLINTLYGNLYTLVIGKLFSASNVGFYTQSQQIARIPSANATSIMQRATYPILCKIQNDDERLCSDYRMLLKQSAFIVFPIMCLIAAISKPLILLLLGDNWLFSAKLLVPISLCLMMYPLHALNLNLLQVKGRSDWFLKLEIYKKIVGITVLTISCHFGVYVMCWCSIFASVIDLAINTYYTDKLLKLGFIKQMMDVMPIFAICMVMMVASYLSTLLFSMPILQCIVGGLLGGMIYFGLARFLRFKELEELIVIVKSVLVLIYDKFAR